MNDSFDGPVSPRYGAYILKSAYDQLQAQAAQLLKECDVWYDNSKIMAEAYVELKEKLQAAEAERDKLLCGDLYKHWEKQNIEPQAQLAAAEAEIERLRHGHYKDDHRFHPLKAENDNLRAEIERLNINLTEHAKDHADDWKRIQDAERKLEETLAREKRDVKHSLELAERNAELLKWCERLADKLSEVMQDNRGIEYSAGKRLLDEYESFKKKQEK